jgi:hypothetical protein
LARAALELPGRTFNDPALAARFEAMMTIEGLRR